MALYSIGDLHLTQSVSKPMGIFGEKWHNHAEKLKIAFSALQDDDICVICGDLSWGMNFKECREDFLLIDSFPGQKIILKGNHDYWWSTVSKAYAFFEECGISSIKILNNNSFDYDRDTAICGTRGWFYEEESGGEHDKKIMDREIGRLRTSLESAGNKNKIVFLHYPPLYSTYRCEEILDLFSEFNVRLCCYGHIHGKACGGAINGWYGNTEYKLVSADFVNFTPQKLLV